MRVFDFDITLFGMSVTAVPDKKDKNKINVLINPISVSSKEPDTFKTVDELKSTVSFHQDNFPEIFKCFVCVVDTLKELVKRQEESCRNVLVSGRKPSHKIAVPEVAVILGQDSRYPVNADLFSALLFGHEANTETRIKDYEERVKDDKALLEKATTSYLKSFTYQLDQMLEYVLPRLTTDELKQSTCNAFNDVLGKDLSSPIVIGDLADRDALAQKIIAAAKEKYWPDFNNHTLRDMDYLHDHNTFLYDVQNGSLGRRTHDFCQYIAKNVSEEMKPTLLDCLSIMFKDSKWSDSHYLFCEGINPQRDLTIALMHATRNDPRSLEILINKWLSPRVAGNSIPAELSGLEAELKNLEAAKDKVKLPADHPLRTYKIYPPQKKSYDELTEREKAGVREKALVIAIGRSERYKDGAFLAEHDLEKIRSYEADYNNAKGVRAAFLEQTPLPPEFLRACSDLADLAKKCCLKKGAYNGGGFSKDYDLTGLEQTSLDKEIIRLNEEGDFSALKELARKVGREDGTNQARSTANPFWNWQAPPGYGKKEGDEGYDPAIHDEVRKRCPRYDFIHQNWAAYMEGFRGGIGGKPTERDGEDGRKHSVNEEGYWGPRFPVQKRPLAPNNAPFTDIVWGMIQEVFETINYSMPNHPKPVREPHYLDDWTAVRRRIGDLAKATAEGKTEVTEPEKQWRLLPIISKGEDKPKRIER